MNDIDSSFLKMPIVSANTDQIIGFEVLLKSFHGISLKVFNDNPELYCELSSQMLKAIIELDAKGKIRKASELLYLNLTPAQFLSPSTLDFLYSLYAKHQKLSNFVIEFTEHDLHCDLYRFEERILLFKQIGCQFAIDDFGMNVSNFQRVFEINTEFIKIDRGLIVRYDNHKANIEALTQLVRLCHKLDKKVIIEGIETNVQLKQAKACGADFLQGFIYGFPELIV